MIKPWTAQELDVLTALYGKRMNRQIAALLPGRTENGIKFKARELGLKSNRKLTRKQYAVNHDYFSIPSLQNSYWAGFIAADGNIGDPKDRVRIKILESDGPHLVAFSEHCGSTSPIRNAPNGPRSYSSLEIHGVPQWRADLERNFCVTPRKTFTLQPPAHLPQDLSLAFITGYIDGDGCISTEQPPHGRLRLRLQITSTQNMLLWTKSWFDRLAPSIYEANVCPMGQVFSYRIVGQKAQAVCETLLALRTPKLNRKWIKASQFLEQKEKDNSV